MSSNQIGGFFNRLEASRKYLFGSLGVLGEANKSIISGAFITRGDDIKLSVDCAPDWESYEYKKLDLANDSDKKFFEDALAWDLELDGKKWADGKNVGHPERPSVERFSAADYVPLSSSENRCLSVPSVLPLPLWVEHASTRRARIQKKSGDFDGATRAFRSVLPSFILSSLAMLLRFYEDPEVSITKT